MRTIHITGSLLLLTPLAFAACSDAAVAPDTDIPLMSASGGNGVHHVAAGSGHVVLNDGTRRMFSFNAKEYNDGRAPTGQFQIRRVGPGNPEFFLKGYVTCLSVPDDPSNEAWIAGVVTRASVPTRIGKGAWFRVKDQGERHSDLGNDQITLAEILPTPAAAETECLNNTGAGDDGPFFGIDQGNIQVAASG